MSTQNAKYTPEQTQRLNQDIYNLAQDGSPASLMKIAQARDTVIRTELREEGFFGKIVPLERINPSDLHPALDGSLQVIRELQPASAGAVSVGFGTMPQNSYPIKGPKYKIGFSRIVTDEYRTDVAQLLGYNQPLPEIMSQQTILDAQTVLDTRLVGTMNRLTAAGATATPTAGAGEVAHTNGNAPSATGKKQWIRFTGGMTVANWITASSALARGNSSGRYRLRNHIALCNDRTSKEFLRLDALAIGDSAKSDQWKNGLTSDSGFGVKIVMSMKDDLIPDGTFYFIAAPEFIGSALYLEDWTTYIEKKAFTLSMFSHWFGGYSWANAAAVVRADELIS